VVQFLCSMELIPFVEVNRSNVAIQVVSLESSLHGDATPGLGVTGSLVNDHIFSIGHFRFSVKVSVV